MGLTLRCRYWSIIQVIIIATCSGKKVSSEIIVDGCDESQLSLECPNMTVIQITSVYLGDSGCFFSCCINNGDCTHAANRNHRMVVQGTCDNKQSCKLTVGVLKEQIPCGWRKSWSQFFWPYNDFERITYDCIDNPRNDTVNNSTYEDPMEDDNSTDSNAGFVPEIAQGCAGSHLSLRCEEMEVIKILDVLIGSLNGVPRPAVTACNISDINCTQDANANHTMDVHHRCDGQRNCTVDFVQETTNCGTWGLRSQSDIELIAYNCLKNLTMTDGAVTGGGITNSNLVITIVLAIICPIILLVIIIVAVVMYRRKERERVKKHLDPIAMTDVDNRQNGVVINANESHNGNVPLHHYSIIKRQDEAESPKTDKHPIVYSEVELRDTISTDGQSDRVTTDKSKAGVETHATKPDVYAAVNSQTGTVSKAPTTQDDGGQTVIENDLYGLTDNSAQEIMVETPTYSLAGAVSKGPSSQEDDGLTVIENDLYCH